MEEGEEGDVEEEREVKANAAAMAVAVVVDGLRNAISLLFIL